MMQTLIVILIHIQAALLLAVSGPATEDTVLCGYNGQSYGKFCNAFSMNLFNDQQTDKNLYYVEKPLVDCTNKPCPKVCISLHAPVCAINGEESKIFPNDCELQNQNECAAKASNQIYTSTGLSVCSLTTTSPPTTTTSCTLNCVPVSYPVPTTGGWFNNQCLMEESNFCLGTTYSVLYGYNSYGDAPIQCPAVCGVVYARTCANDGSVNQTFGNQCLLDGYNRCVRGSSQPHFQAVPFSQSLDCFQTSSLSCPLNCYMRRFEPVCATNGMINRWFPNACELENYNKCGTLTPQNFVETSAPSNCL